MNSGLKLKSQKSKIQKKPTRKSKRIEKQASKPDYKYKNDIISTINWDPKKFMIYMNEKIPNCCKVREYVEEKKMQLIYFLKMEIMADKSKKIILHKIGRTEIYYYGGEIYELEDRFKSLFTSYNTCKCVLLGLIYIPNDLPLKKVEKDILKSLKEFKLNKLNIKYKLKREAFESSKEQYDEVKRQIKLLKEKRKEIGECFYPFESELIPFEQIEEKPDEVSGDEEEDEYDSSFIDDSSDEEYT